VEFHKDSIQYDQVENAELYSLHTT
jgi:hypothetical protein